VGRQHEIVWKPRLVFLWTPLTFIAWTNSVTNSVKIFFKIYRLFLFCRRKSVIQFLNEIFG